MNENTQAEHILVCLSSAPSNAKIIRTAARMAAAFHSKLTALFVETPAFAAASAEDHQRLLDNRKLAQRLGASIETVYGDDVAFLIAEYARLLSITRIVLGQSAVKRRHLLGKMTLTEQLISHAPGLDIHIIPDKAADSGYRPTSEHRRDLRELIRNIGKSLGILAGATGLSLLFYEIGFTHANIIMVYILGVLLTSIATSGRVYSLISSFASVIIFNYLFTAPRFSLAAYDTGYPVTFLVMFLTAYITGTLAIRYKEQAGHSAKSAHRMKILLETDRLLAKAGSKQAILDAAAAQIGKLLDRPLVIFENDGGRLSAPYLYPSTLEMTSKRELEVAHWVLANNRAAGATTDRMQDAEYLYLALRVSQRVYGVVGILAKHKPLDASEQSILLSILGECALALENEKNTREKEAAAILAENERLRANLLRTISHDLRTPLTTISGNADNLLSCGNELDSETRHRLYQDIYDDAQWLTDLVENLLSATRIEESHLGLNTSAELLYDILDSAMQHCKRKVAGRCIEFLPPEDLLLVRVDPGLVTQVIVNLLDNALKYTPHGSCIKLSATAEDAFVRVSVADDGPGIPDEEKPLVFEKFFCCSGSGTEHRRQLGLGLYLCRAIVEAHGGTIGVKDNLPHGAIFHFTLPREEIPHNE